MKKPVEPVDWGECVTIWIPCPHGGFADATKLANFYLSQMPWNIGREARRAKARAAWESK